MAVTDVGAPRPGSLGPAGTPDRAGLAHRSGAAPRRRGRARLRIGPSWPFVVLLGGFPLWWALGISEILVFVMALPMALLLVQRRRIVVPRGFWFWMVFLLWMLAGFPMLFADAPGTIPGGGAARIPIFLYRVAWYGSCTIVMLWIGNLDEEDLPVRRVVRLVGWMFVVTTSGGILGVLAPTFEFTSLFQTIVGNHLASSEFIQAIAHPQAASIQKLIGAADARPIAPFAYANTWGSVMALSLPFFLIGWLGPDAGWRRRVGPVILVAAAVPTILSLNRGLWICLVVGAIVLAVRLALNGQALALVALGLTIAIGGGLLMASPLGDTLTKRLANGKSNDRRSQLLTETVKTTIKGSPVIGFGSTRRVPGTFDSIAGGETAQCKACGVPPLGTQGHIWLVIFSQGLGGLFFFLAFFGRQFATYWRSRTTLQAAGTIILIFYFIQLFIYDTLGWPLYLIMTAMALMWRERWRTQELSR